MTCSIQCCHTYILGFAFFVIKIDTIVRFYSPTHLIKITIFMRPPPSNFISWSVLNDSQIKIFLHIRICVFDIKKMILHSISMTDTTLLDLECTEVTTKSSDESSSSSSSSCEEEPTKLTWSDHWCRLIVSSRMWFLTIPTSYKDRTIFSITTWGKSRWWV